MGLLLLSQRLRVPEIMDQADLPEAEHRQALAGLKRLNRLSFAHRPMLGPILHLAGELKRDRLRVLDVACGGGDVPLALARRARHYGITLQLTLLDRSPTALDQARSAAEACGLSIETIVGDVTSADLPEADVVTNSLFLHHLEIDEVIAVLQRLAHRARHLLLISDLRRSAVGLALAATHCRLLTRSAVVHHDGPASVRAAWTAEELRRMALVAGLAGATVRHIWPWRMLLQYRKTGAA